MRRYSSVLAVLVSVILGLLLPQIGIMWSSYTSIFLGLLMFMVALSVELQELFYSVRDYRMILVAFLMVLVFPPIISLLGKPFFAPVEYAGIVLALSAPSAISSVFWCDVFGGHTPLALIISILTNLLAIVTLPVTLLLMIGLTSQVDSVTIIVNLIFLIVIPITAGQIIRRVFTRSSKKLVEKSPIIQHILIILLIWGATAPGAVFTRNNALIFAVFNIFFLLVLSGIFVLAYLIGRRFGQSQAIALGLVSSHKNATLAIVLGGLLLGPAALLPLIANLVAQNIFLIPARLVLESRRRHSKVCA